MAVQTNVIRGKIVRIASVDLTGKENYLAKLVYNAGDPTGAAALPTALADRVPYLIQDGAAAGKNVELIPLYSEQQFRVVAKGIGNAGDTLSAADPVVPADAGKLRKTPATTGTFGILAIAEENFVDGQNVLCRPFKDSVTNP